MGNSFQTKAAEGPNEKSNWRNHVDLRVNPVNISGGTAMSFFTGWLITQGYVPRVLAIAAVGIAFIVGVMIARFIWNSTDDAKRERAKAAGFAVLSVIVIAAIASLSIWFAPSPRKVTASVPSASSKDTPQPVDTPAPSIQDVLKSRLLAEELYAGEARQVVEHNTDKSKDWRAYTAAKAALKRHMDYPVKTEQELEAWVLRWQQLREIIPAMSQMFGAGVGLAAPPPSRERKQFGGVTPKHNELLNDIDFAIENIDLQLSEIEARDAKHL